MVTVCPRCGYDQAGAMAAWERLHPARCPLDGVCTECGLAFLWRDLLNEEFARQGRLFEHARLRRGRSFVRTVWCALRPWVLWRMLRMEQRIAWRRLTFLALAGCILTGAIAAAALSRCAWLYHEVDFRLAGNMMNGNWSDSFAYWQLTRWPPRSVTYSQLWIHPEQLRELVAPWLVVGVLAFAISPACFALLPATLRRARVRRRHLARIWMYGLVSLPLVLAAPVVLVTLAAILTSVDFVVHRNAYWLRGLGVWWERHTWVPQISCASLWLGVWWWMAAGRYLRLPHAAGIGLAVVLLAVLVAVGLIAVVPGGAHWIVWDW